MDNELFCNFVRPVFAQGVSSELTSPPPGAKYLGSDLVLFFVGDKMDSLMALDVDGQVGILVVGLAGALGQVDVDDAVAEGSLDVEPQAHVVGAPHVRLFGAGNVAVAGPARP